MSLRSPARWIGAAILVLAIILVYQPGLDGGYIFDDITNIVQNTPLHVASLSPSDWMAAAFSSPASDLQRPLSMLTFAANHYFTGLEPRPMKIANLAIHCANALLAFALARLLIRSWRDRHGGDPGRDELAAWIIAGAWALNPINVMGVLYVVQRMESLAHLFVFTGLLCYVHGRREQLAGRPGWRPILCAFLVAMPVGALAKESAVLLPLYAFCIELALFRFRPGAGVDRKRLGAMFAAILWLPAMLAVAWLLPRALRPGAFANRGFNVFERLLTEGRVLVDYLHWTLLPNLRSLGFYHDDYAVSRGWFDPPATSVCIAFLAALAVAAFAIRGRRPLSALGIALFLGAHAITASFVSLELVFEHRNYFASFGLMLVVGDLFLLLPQDRARRLYGAVVCGLLVVFYAAGTWSRAQEWSDPLRFARSEALKHPQSPRAQYGLARILVIQSEYDKQSPYWAQANDAIATARAVPGSGILPAQAALIFAARSGDAPDPRVWEELEAKYRTLPLGAEQIGALAALVECSNSKLCPFAQERMLAVFASALSRGDKAEILNIYGSYSLNSLHDIPFTVRLWEEALRLRPSEAQYHVNLIRLAIALGQFDVAEQGIGRLEALGRLGQNRARAATLRAELARARTQGPAPARSAQSASGSPASPVSGA